MSILNNCLAPFLAQDNIINFYIPAICAARPLLGGLLRFVCRTWSSWGGTLSLARPLAIRTAAFHSRSALLPGVEFLLNLLLYIEKAYQLLRLKNVSDEFSVGGMLGSHWWIALILGILLIIFGLVLILNPVFGLDVIGTLVGCSVITAGINLIHLGCSPWLL